MSSIDDLVGKIADIPTLQSKVGVFAGRDGAGARVTIGTTTTTAAAGNHVHAATVVTVAASAGIVGANVQAVLANLASRVVALEAKP